MFPNQTALEARPTREPGRAVRFNRAAWTNQSPGNPWRLSSPPRPDPNPDDSTPSLPPQLHPSSSSHRRRLVPSWASGLARSGDPSGLGFSSPFASKEALACLGALLFGGGICFPIFSEFYLNPNAPRQVRRSHTMFPCHGVATANAHLLGVAGARYGSPARPFLRARPAFLSLRDPAFCHEQKSFALRGKIHFIFFLTSNFNGVNECCLCLHFSLRTLSFHWKNAIQFICIQYSSRLLDS